jgi:para-nitrobenzyl esterase
MYSFNWETPVFDGKLRSPHAIDVPFAFDTIDAVNSTDKSPAVHALADAESATWAAFARAGVPDNAAIPQWPAYNTDSRATMMIDAEWKVENDPAHEARLMWEKIALA